MGIAFVDDERAPSIPDISGRVATMRAMESSPSHSPDLGYWAERWDPEGMLQPFSNTGRVGSSWVTVGTLPTLYLGLPLFELGGYRLALLIPMLGGIACAFAARKYSWRFAPSSAGWTAFWIIGLASPITLYSVEFWDQSVGAALVAWGVLALWSGYDQESPTLRMVAAGLLLGAAATLRTESVVYGAVAIIAFGIADLVRRRRVVRVAASCAVVLVAAILPLVVNAGLEQAAFGTQLRSACTDMHVRVGRGYEFWGRGVRTGQGRGPVRSIPRPE